MNRSISGFSPMKSPRMGTAGSRFTTPSSARGRTTSNADGLFVDTNFEEIDDLDPASQMAQDVVINNGFSSRYSPIKEGTVGTVSGVRKQKQQTFAPALTDHQIQQKITHIVIQRPSNRKDFQIYDVNPTSEPLNDIAEIKKLILNPEYVKEPRNQFHSNSHVKVFCPLHSQKSAALYIEFNPVPVYKEPPTFMTSDKSINSPQAV